MSPELTLHRTHQFLVEQHRQQERRSVHALAPEQGIEQDGCDGPTFRTFLQRRQDVLQTDPFLTEEPAAGVAANAQVYLAVGHASDVIRQP